ncbi:dipeptide/oligopeptide/nickel ABC transporter permease/ATP-binding protein [Amycolatopsis pithecellobii]|uniref:ATP-binding cassette domain-containing protein n=1 Tax=Amycolatopsis pithecellobii TaxID=664692 RepID=A0A6N7Z019_9PSEU|nr:dipeptide/oligopeptide/nickel ABC transporter permease/ATP-binding protein [Amycolatopsis pithecellobii]MTD52734.1 ATP-binding cassette domain-containing protein [Amycolatopsis pithecellobii]
MTVALLPVATAPTARRDNTWLRVLRRPLGAVSLVFLALLVLAVAAAPLIAPYGPLTQDLQATFAGPSAQHLLGTDNLGRDILSRLLHGGQVSLLGVAYAVAVLLIGGVPTGLVAGYHRGRIDAVVVRVTDVVLAIPVIITLLVVLATFGQNEVAAMITFGLLGTPGMIRVVRAATIAIRADLYLTAARVAGLSTTQIIRRHVLPRVAGPIIVRAFLFAGAALLTESGLAFLGLGVQEPEPSWGGMVASASIYINQHPSLLIPAGVTIALTVLAFGLVGDAVRDAIGGRHLRYAGSARPAPHPVDSGTDEETPSALLSVRGLSVGFPGETGFTTVVNDVSFEVRAGETVGLVGESGCGKSVTARAVLGLLASGGAVTTGRCWFDGEDLRITGRNRCADIRGSQVGLISQEPSASLDPNLTVGRQLAEIVRRHRTVSRSQARVEALDLLQKVQMPEPVAVAGRYPHELSGGMAQRVCIAAALAGRPRLLIADEPTTALDVTVQAEILDLLRHLQETTGMAILLVTHDWGVVADLCHRAVVMYAGQVVESTEVEPMFRRPLHPYTDGLLKSNPHRVVVGERLPAIAGTVPPPHEWPRGCHFHPRCPLAGPDCMETAVPIFEPTPGRLTRCLHHDRLAVGARHA